MKAEQTQLDDLLLERYALRCAVTDINHKILVVKGMSAIGQAEERMLAYYESMLARLKDKLTILNTRFELINLKIDCVGSAGEQPTPGPTNIIQQVGKGTPDNFFRDPFYRYSSPTSRPAGNRGGL